MKLMTDILIKTNFDIKDVILKNKKFKRNTIRRLIHKLRNNLYEAIDINGDEIRPCDIVNLALLVDTANKLGFTDSIIESYEVKCSYDNNKSKWPIVGTVSADFSTYDDSYYIKKIELSSCMDNKDDITGTISISLEIIDRKKYEDDKISSITMKKDVNLINRHTIQNYTGSWFECLKVAYFTYPEISCIFIENILDGIRKRYLK